MDSAPLLADRRFNDDGHVSDEAAVDCDAEPMAGGKLSPPLRLLRRQLDHMAQAPCIDGKHVDVVTVIRVIHAAPGEVDMPRRPKQFEEVVLRIAAGRMRQAHRRTSTRRKRAEC